MVGLALTLALVLDAVLDPIVGYWSDNFRSKWGRRHPFMYASAIPIAVFFYLLWTPPQGWDHQALFWYLLTFAILTRAALTFFETPNAALAPELTRDYDERSTLQSVRFDYTGRGESAQQVVDRFGELSDAGAQHVIFSVFDVFDPRAMEVLGRDVIPQLHALA